MLAILALAIHVSLEHAEHNEGKDLRQIHEIIQIALGRTGTPARRCHCHSKPPSAVAVPIQVYPINGYVSKVPNQDQLVTALVACTRSSSSHSLNHPVLNCRNGTSSRWGLTHSGLLVALVQNVRLLPEISDKLVKSTASHVRGHRGRLSMPNI